MTCTTIEGEGALAESNDYVVTQTACSRSCRLRLSAAAHHLRSADAFRREPNGRAIREWVRFRTRADAPDLSMESKKLEFACWFCFEDGVVEDDEPIEVAAAGQ